MLTFAKKYGKNVFSQFGEDGIIEECLRRIDPKEKTAVEFGAPSWEFCSNTAYLAEKGWDVRMYDIDHNADPRIKQAEITPDNVNFIVNSPSIPSVLSMDTDGPDYRLWAAYRGDWQAFGEPDIVIIEIDSSVAPPKEQFPFELHQGASYISMVRLGLIKGYFVICHTGNIIFCLKKYRHLFPEITGDPIKDHELYFNTSHL